MNTVVAGMAQRYGFAVLSTMLATLVRVGLQSELEERNPFGLYFLSVILTAWIAGTGPAILALTGGIFAAAHWIIQPDDSWLLTTTADQLALLVYGIVGAVAILLFHRSSREAVVLQQRGDENKNLSERLRDVDRRKDEFLALLAHELRNPLAPIRSGLQILDKEEELSFVGRETRHVIGRQVDQLIRLVDDLFDVSRFLRGQLRIDREVIDLRNVIDLALHTAEPILDEHEHDLKYLRPQHPVLVEGDEVRLTQVVSNLLTNAARYTPRRGRIRVLLDVVGNEARMQVSDNGIGVPLDSQASIFDVFTQADSAQTRDHGGLGLGLAIVRQIVELHGGRVSVCSAGSGRGSSFTALLPLAPKSPPAEEPSSGSSVTAEASAPADAKRIMIVDDNHDAAQTLATLLSYDGYATQVAHDGHSALSHYDNFDPDVVLLDIGMPGMDGYEVARQLRSRPDHSRCKIIAVTGWGQESDRVQSRLAGIDHHFVKPVDVKALLQLISEVDGEEVSPSERETRCY